MSTEFISRRGIACERIRNFNHRGVTARPEDDYLFLSDGTNFTHVYPAEKGRRVSFIRQGDNDI